ERETCECHMQVDRNDMEMEELQLEDQRFNSSSTNVPVGS
ncbi:uncharacterized, partial [Tachysurus ichikawai]